MTLRELFARNDRARLIIAEYAQQNKRGNSRTSSAAPAFK